MRERNPKNLNIATKDLMKNKTSKAILNQFLRRRNLMSVIFGVDGGTCLLRLYLLVFAQTKRCEFAPTQKGNFAKKYK